MSFLAWARAFAVAVLLQVFTASVFGSGFSYTPPPNSITIKSAKRSHIFFVGEVVQFQISAPANRYEVRDYYGNLVDQNTISGTSFPVKVTDPGWYKLDIFGTIDQGQPWGQVVANTMFCIFRNKAGFPEVPPTEPNAYALVDDEAIRGVTGMGPQRHFVNDTNNPDADIARLRQEIDIDKQVYLPFDPVRKRCLLIAFPGGTLNLTGVRRVIEAFKDDVKYFEPRNEPNFNYNGTDFVTAELIPFYQTVKSVDPTLKVVGPGVVTIGPYGLYWIDAFLTAGGGNYIDAFSFHAYNNVNGDPFLAIRSLQGLNELLAKHNLSNIEKWQTEQGYMSAVFGTFQPRLQGRWTMLQMMIFEQYGIPKEHNHLWYDRFRQFWGAPMWWENFDASLTPAPALMRVWSEELYGTTFSKALNFGETGDKLYFGCLFAGPGKKVMALMSGNGTDGRVQLAVTGGSSIHYVSPWGLEYDLPVTAGRVTIPVPELPVYVELAPGQSVEVVPVNWGANLMIQQGVTASSSGSGANPFPNIPNSITKLFNQTFETWYYSQTDGDWPWMDNTAGFPAWVELDLPSVQTVDHVVVYSSPPWQIWGTLLDYELQYQQNGQWITLEHVQEPAKTWNTYTQAAYSTVDSYFSDRCVFQHSFAPVQTQKIRLLIHNVTWGGGATQDVVNAGGQTGPRNICLREIEVYNASLLGGGSGTSTGNSPPSVNIFAPSDSSIYSAPATIAISANAFDLDGNIAKVEFFANGTKLGEKTAGQYSFTWNNIPQGYYLLTARATDNSGATTDTSTVAVTVGANGNESGPVIASGSGITGQYFGATDFTSPRFTRQDATINFNWGLGAPDTSMPSDFFTVRWSGQVEAQYTETYTFYTQSDDGCRVWVNGQKIIDNFSIHSWEEHSGTIALRKGQRYDIIVEFLEWGGGAEVSLLWSSPSQAKNFIPTSQLYPLGSPAQPTPLPANAPPSVVLASPSGGPVFTAPANLTFQASASDSNGTISKVEFLADNYKIGEATAAPYIFTWNNATAGTYSIKARAVDNLGASSLSAPINVTINAPIVLTSASYIKTDALTKGNWKGVYGSEGANVIGNASNYPSYATVVHSGHSSYTWAAFTPSEAALLKLSTNERIASCWYSSGSFTIDVNISDGQSHSLALYALDWGGGGTRSEKVEIFDATTGALLDTHTVASFEQGKYLVWDVRGHVRLKVTNAPSSANAVVSGLFFGPAYGVPNPISATITNPTNGSSVTAPWSTVISANAGNSNGILTKVEFYSGSTKLGEDTNAPYTLSWNNVAAGTYTLTAVAYDSTGSSVASSPINVTVNPPNVSAAITYIKTDTITQGSWKGIYGADGAHVIGETASYPAYASVTPSGNASWTWSPSTSSQAALEKISSTDRIASCWYSQNIFTVDVHFTDGQTHGLALYTVDWDNYGPRTQTVEILDAVSGAVVDSRPVSSFSNGRYLVWDARGHIQIRITNTSPIANAVVSGLFFGPPASSQTAYGNWAVANGLTGSNSSASNDFDRDGSKNLLEWAFATDPKVPGAGALMVNGTTIVRHGTPTLLAISNGSGGVNLFAAFGRRKDFATAGLTYSTQFSNDMTTWTTSTASPTVIAQDGEIEVLTVPYPPLPDGKQASFFRVNVSTQ